MHSNDINQIHHNINTRLVRSIRWLHRIRLELRLSHHCRIADTLSEQITNDIDALAYTDVCIAAIRLQLQEVGQSGESA